jgi:hypothetical protein
VDNPEGNEVEPDVVDAVCFRLADAVSFVELVLIEAETTFGRPSLGAVIGCSPFTLSTLPVLAELEDLGVSGELLIEAFVVFVVPVDVEEAVFGDFVLVKTGFPDRATLIL